MISLKTGAFALAALLALAAPAQAQIRAPALDPTQQKLNALSQKVDALAQSAGRQVVSFEFSSEGLNTWTNAENTFPNNEQRAQNLCKELLSDRYGRVLSRRAQPAGDRWYFRHLVCETRP